MTESKPNRQCPICGKPAMEHVRPFCSRRCADVDLHRWLSGSYRIPAPESDDDEKESVRPPPEEES